MIDRVVASPLSPDDESPVGARAIRRVRARLVPFLALLYLIAYLDRVNVAFAALQMNEALRFSASVYGRGAGMFFLGYFLFEIPSNLMLARVGARLWIARIAVVWGVVAIAMLFVSGLRSFYTLRFLLGAAEAGFFPGIVLYFTYWFPARERARAVAQFSVASMAAGIIGAPLSGALLSLRGLGGLDGWQWLFLVEGLPAVVLGLVALLYLSDEPSRADWLQEDERAWLIETLRKEREGLARAGLEREGTEREGIERRAAARAKTRGRPNVRAGLIDPAVWRLAAVLFLIVTSGYGFSFFLPQIVKALSGTLERGGNPRPVISDLAVGLWSALPFLGAAIAMVLVARHSDRTGERRWHVAGSAWVAALGLASSMFLHAPAASFLAIIVAAVGLYSATPPFWSLPTGFLRGDGAAAGIAFINAVGNLGGFAGPYVMGLMKDWSGTFVPGLLTLAGAAVLSGALVLTARE